MFSSAVLEQWQSEHSACMFGKSSSPPSARGVMWSTCQSALNRTQHVAQRHRWRAATVARWYGVSVRRSTGAGAGLAGREIAGSLGAWTPCAQVLRIAVL